MKIKLFLACLMMFHLSAHAINDRSASKTTHNPYRNSRYDECFINSGKEFNIDPLLLKSIGIQESSLNPRAVNNNRDFSLMQINTWWMDNEWFRRNKITIPALLDDGCLSIRAGAWILAGNFALNGVNWQSVGGYNAGFSPENERARQIYIGLIRHHYAILKGINEGDTQVIADISEQFRNLPVDTLRDTFSMGAHQYKVESKGRKFNFGIVKPREFVNLSALTGGL